MRPTFERGNRHSWPPTFPQRDEKPWEIVWIVRLGAIVLVLALILGVRLLAG